MSAAADELPSEDPAHRRTRLMGDLAVLNAELARNHWPEIISNQAAGFYDTDELPGLIESTRLHLRYLAEVLRGLA